MWPCIRKDLLPILASTADERCMFGERVFQETHYPVTYRRYNAAGQAAEWTEERLFGVLNEPGAVRGNRTFVLYGAAGAGKSETMKWLEYRMRRTDRAPVMLRVSRTELDPVRILRKIVSNFKGVDLDAALFNRWDELRHKPVTLANHIVWSALGKMLPGDDEIIPVSYRLRPVVEKNLRLNFAGVDDPEYTESRTPELISREQLEALADTHALPFRLDAEQLRFEMVREMENSILGGYSFVDTLRGISREVHAQKGVRPLLLIDDLVQSMNIYAGDILDYLATVEEGHWDVVLGLTPAAFETSKRGREILNRITNLDTFDDRLTKLWLTDSQGHRSSFLNVGNCHLYAARYLRVLKNLAGYACDAGCPLQARCAALQMNMHPGSELAPFNAAFLRRLYGALPSGKGKARYFVRAMGEVLEQLIDGNFSAVPQHLRRECAVDDPDPVLRFIGEAYAPEAAVREGYVQIPGAVRALFGAPGPDNGSTTVRVSTLLSAASRVGGERDGAFDGAVDPSKTAIRDWLEGREVNRELLRGLRMGVAHLCRELARPGHISRDHTVRQNPVLKWEQAVDGSKIPIVLEGVGDYPGVFVPRSIGHAAYRLHYLHLRRGGHRERCLRDLLENEEVLLVVDRARVLKKYYVRVLESELGLKVDALAYLLFTLRSEMQKESRRGAGDYPGSLAELRVCFPEDQADLITELFKDWFLIRENVYDGWRLTQLEQEYRGRDLLRETARLDPRAISPQFRIGRVPLARFMEKVQETAAWLESSLASEKTAAEVGYFQGAATLLKELQHPAAYSEIGRLTAEIGSRWTAQPGAVPEWQICVDTYARLKDQLQPFLSGTGGLLVTGPLAMHQLLLTLGDIEKDKDFRVIRELCTFIRAVECRLAGALERQRKTQATGWLGTVAGGGSAGGTTREVAAGFTVDRLSRLLRRVTEYGRRERQLKLLTSAAPFIDPDLDRDARTIAGCAAGMRTAAPARFPAADLRAVLTSCRRYAALLDALRGPTGHGTADLIGELAAVHGALTTVSLCDQLLAVRARWVVYLRMAAALNTHAGAAGPSALRATIETLERLDPGDFPGPLARQLVSTAGMLEGLPAVAETAPGGDTDADHAYLLDQIFGSPGGVRLTDANLELARGLLRRVPLLSEAVRLKAHP